MTFCNHSHPAFSLLFLFNLCLLLLSCGASTSTTTSASSSGSRIVGIDGTGGELPGDVTKITSIGAIEYDGQSLIVNNVDYDIQDSEIILDGNIVTSSELLRGQVVSIQSYESNETSTKRLAQSVIAFNIVRGTASIDENDQLTILKQKITINEDTAFNDSLSAESELTGLYLQVSGYRLASGTLVATLIQQANINSPRQIAGNVSNMQKQDNQLTVNSLTINTSNIIIDSAIENGTKVLVTGVEINDQGELIAGDIIALDKPEEDSNLVEVEGFITSNNGLFEFNIGDFTIKIDDATLYKGGDLKNITTDTKVRAFTEKDVDGNLLAKEVIFLQSTLLDFKAGDTLPSDTVTFKWSDVEADEYLLKVATIYGENITIFNEQFDSDTFSATVSDLPQNGAQVDVILGTRHGRLWNYETARVRTEARLIKPVFTNLDEIGSLTGSAATFRWTDVGADEYRLFIFNNGVLLDERTTATELSIDNLPQNAATLNIYLYSRNGLYWNMTKHAVISPDNVENSVLTSPPTDQPLPGETTTLTWSDTGALEHRVIVYSQIQRRTILSKSFDSSTFSYSISGLPKTSSTVVVKVESKHGEGWGTNTYVFEGTGELASSEITSHNDQDIFSPGDAVTWSVPSHIEAVSLSIKKVLESRDVTYQKTFTPDTNSVLVEDIPRNGAKFDVIIKSLHDQWWVEKYVRLNSYPEHGKLSFVNHTKNETVNQDNAILEWTNINADAYRLYIDNESYDFPGSITSADISELANSNGLKTVRILAQHDGWWVQETSAITIDLY